ncbi:MAG: SOS response-associated peptidase [bacterium]
MCGRYYLYVGLDELLQRYGINNSEINFTPAKEIFPSENTPVVIQNRNNNRELKLFKWGFNTSFTSNLIINARGETVAEKRTFKNAFREKRCLVPVTGFFEWKQTGDKKIKYRIELLKENIFSLAGIFEIFNNNGKAIPSFTIITTTACKSLKPIHPRMPVILNRKNEKQWLNITNNADSLKKLLTPYDDRKLDIKPDNGQMQFSFNQQ